MENQYIEISLVRDVNAVRAAEVGSDMAPAFALTSISSRLPIGCLIKVQANDLSPRFVGCPVLLPSSSLNSRQTAESNTNEIRRGES
jgi:hypothetical protein